MIYVMRILIFIILWPGSYMLSQTLYANGYDHLLDDLEQSVMRSDYDTVSRLIDSLEESQLEISTSQHLRKLWLIASHYYSHRALDKSFELVKELHSMAEANNDSMYIARALYRTGTLFYHIGNRDKYHEYIGKAEGISLSVGDIIIHARCKMGRLNTATFVSCDDFDPLQAGYLECYDLVKDLKGAEAFDTQLAILFNLFGAYDLHGKEYLGILHRILDLSKKANREDTYAGGLFRLYKYNLINKDTSSALKSLETAYDVAFKIKDHTILTDLCMSLAQLYKDLGKHDKAYDFAMKVYHFSKVRENQFVKSGQNALSRYNEITDLSTENKKLVELNESAIIDMQQLRKMNIGIGLFGLSLILSGLFWVQQYKLKNKNKLIMAEQQAQIWNERFISAEKDKKMELLTSFQEGQEIIKDRIAMVLHDKIAGGIAGIKLFLSNEPAIQTEKISPILGQLDELYDYSRNLSHFYYDPLPENVPFCDLIKKRAQKSSYNTGIQLECILYPEEKINDLPPLIKTEVLRYISELIRNVEVHSKATVGEITLTLQEEGLYITVVDNGVGKLNKNEGQEGIGIQIIRKRLTLLDGDIEISSQERKGYTCIIFIPNKVILNIDQKNFNV